MYKMSKNYIFVLIFICIIAVVSVRVYYSNRKQYNEEYNGDYGKNYGNSDILYCKVYNCPLEALINSDYCFEHKCVNGSCNNRATKCIDYLRFCSECAKRAER